MKHTCAACKVECECDEADLPEGKTVPKGWFSRCIEDDDYTLCDVCGNIRHFKGGVSAYLVDCLNLDFDARCDVSEEVAALKVERSVGRRRRTKIKA